MQQPVGDIVRKIRKLRHLTQKDVAGERFSKSYLSAVEHNRITPSPAALHYLAERLGQQDGNFAALLQQLDAEKEVFILDTTPHAANNGQMEHHPALKLLSTMLEQVESPGFSPHHTLPTLPTEALTSLPQTVQVRYYFLRALQARERRAFPAALRAFETALTLASSQQHATILDEIGSCYFLQQEYLTALGHYLHALHLLSQEPGDSASVARQSKIELHCGEAYRALGEYQQAIVHYEAARKHLSATNDLASTACLYQGLGYCLYAAVYTSNTSSNLATGQETTEQRERQFQHAINILLQSRNIYHAANDRLGEANARLLVARVLLDFSTWRCQVHERARMTGKKASYTDCTSLLHSAYEQCQQVLLSWLTPGLDDEAGSSHPYSPHLANSGASPIPPALHETDSLPGEVGVRQAPPRVEALDRAAQDRNRLDTVLYTALACAIRISVYRAILARLQGNGLDVAYRERAFAAFWCREVLDTLTIPSFPWPMIAQVVNSSAETLEYRSPTLPHFTGLLAESNKDSPRSLSSLIEVYFAAGEVAEELGRAATRPDFAHDCYVQANQFFEAALSQARSALKKGELEPGYLVLLYQRCISLIEERAVTSPALDAETTRALLSVLKQAFRQLQHALQRQHDR